MSHNSSVLVHFQSVAEIAAVVRGFETCTIALADFNHRAHLVVALWYLTHDPLPEATARMRQGLLRFLAHYGEQGYHETITQFWLKLVRRFLDQADTARPLPDLANELLAHCPDAQLLYAHYSRALIQTETAKTAWVEPDLRRLDSGAEV